MPAATPRSSRAPAPRARARTPEDVALRHRGLGAVAHVGEKRSEVGHRLLAAVDVARAGAGRPGTGGRCRARPAMSTYLAQLDVALGAEDREAAVAPGRQAVRREPVDPDVAVAPSRCAASSRRSPRTRGVLGCAKLPTVLATTSASVGAGEEQELVDLVRARCRRGCRRAGAARRTRPGRIARLRRCGPRPTVCTTRPIAPAATSSPAFDARRSKRSEKQIEQMRPVSPARARSSASCVERGHARLVDHARPCRGASPRSRFARAVARHRGVTMRSIAGSSISASRPRPPACRGSACESLRARADRSSRPVARAGRRRRRAGRRRDRRCDGDRADRGETHGVPLRGETKADGTREACDIKQIGRTAPANTRELPRLSAQ